MKKSFIKTIEENGIEALSLHNRNRDMAVL